MYAAGEDEVFLDEPWVTIRWDGEHRCLLMEWKAFANSAEFRAALTRSVGAISEKKAAALLSDTRKIKVIVHEDQQWISDVWVPLVVPAGLKRIALVNAASGLGRVTVDEAAQLVEADKRLLIRSFDSVDAARKWIAEGE